MTNKIHFRNRRCKLGNDGFIYRLWTNNHGFSYYVDDVRPIGSTALSDGGMVVSG